jgi:predicted alpha/beta-hydrolase family hydrolase
MTEILYDGPADAACVLILAHGAGLPMDSPFMTRVAEGVAGRGVRVARFDFPYMAERRATGKKKPPDRQPKLLDSWRAAVAAVRAAHPKAALVVGGKSMGGRMASLLAAGVDRPDDADGLAGLVCLGYPFHPPGKPEKTRTDHLAAVTCPALIVQGTRDPFGTEAEVAGYALGPATRVMWMPDGEHSFKPRKASGRTEDENLNDCVAAVAAFCAEVSDGA